MINYVQSYQLIQLVYHFPIVLNHKKEHISMLKFEFLSVDKQIKINQILENIYIYIYLCIASSNGRHKPLVHLCIL